MRLSPLIALLAGAVAVNAAAPRPHGWLGGGTVFRQDTFTEQPPASISYPVAFTCGFNLGPPSTPNVVLDGNLYRATAGAANITLTGGGGLAWSRTYYPPVTGSEAALLATGVYAPLTGCSIVVDALPVRRTAVYFWAVAGDRAAPLTVTINGSCVVSNWAPAVTPGWRKFGPYETLPAPSGQITIATLPAQACLCALAVWQEVPNQLPVVTIGAPAGGASYVSPATVPCSGTASDSDGSVASVYLVLDGVATNACTLAGGVWTGGLTNLPTGTYRLGVTAVDDRGGRGTIGPVTFTVTPPPNLPPTIALTTPLDGETYTTPPLTNPAPMVAIPLSANASDPDGTIASVVFYAGTTPILTRATAPYTGTWNAAAGYYAVTAKATDDVGATTTTPIAWVTVTNLVLPPTNNPPVIALTLPEDGAGFTAPANITLAATATDSDGTIAWVRFYRDGVLKSTAAAAPYTWTDTAVPAGTYSYHATTMDNSNAVVQAASRTVVVQAPPDLPPTVTLTAPTNNATFTAPVNVPLAASASDPDGSILQVAFYRDGVLVATDLTAPYSATDNAAPVGDLTYRAVATDNSGNLATNDVTIHVAAAPPPNVPPTVTITAPTNGLTTLAPASLSVTASASDSDGTIASVVFIQNGTTVIATDLVAPYTTWSAGLGAGDYTYTAIATDNAGATATNSVLIHVVASPPPQVNAGPDLSVQLPGAATLAGISLNTTSNLWTVVSSNGLVVLADATLTNTVAQFAAAGTYVLRLTGYSATGTASDDLTATVTAAAPPANSILLPVVLGGLVQTRETRSFNLAGIIPGATYYLLLRGHDMRPPGKVSVAVNDSSYVALDNAVTVLGQPATYRGIDGYWPVMWVRVPFTGWLNGQNTVQFRHNGTPNTYCAFIGLQVQDLGGSNLISTNDFVWQDPITGKDYAPTYTDDSAVAAGQSLWETKLWAGTGQACQGCHSASIAATFAFPSVALRSSARASFSELEAEQIVSYIWWRKTHDTNSYPFAPPLDRFGSPQHAGPWNPPYQPAPGLDSLPARQWATGGGIDWVLDNDSDMLAYLFPTGITLARATNIAALKIREVPIPIPLLDVLHWFPCQHPAAIWGADFLNSNVWKDYAGTGWNPIRNRFAAARTAGYSTASMSAAAAAADYFNMDFNQFIGTKTGGPPAPGVYDVTYGRKITDTANWVMSRMLELMREYEIEGHQYKATSREARCWFDHLAFDVAPNILGQQPHSTMTGINDSSDLVFELVDVAWYHLQLILNPGNYSDGSNQSDNRPMDWNYTLYFIPQCHDMAAQHVPLLYLQNVLKEIHVHDNTNGLACWSPTRGGWGALYVSGPPRLANWEVRRMFDGSTLTAGQKAALLDVMLQYWMLKNRQFTPGQYYACGSSIIPGIAYNTAAVDNPGVILPAMIWQAIPEFRTRGVPESTLTDVKSWCATMWPNNNWASR